MSSRVIPVQHELTCDRCGAVETFAELTEKGRADAGWSVVTVKSGGLHCIDLCQPCTECLVKLLSECGRCGDIRGEVL